MSRRGPRNRDRGKAFGRPWEVLAALGMPFLTVFLVAPLTRGYQLLCLTGFLLLSGIFVWRSGTRERWEKAFVPGIFFVLEWVILSGIAHVVRMERTVAGGTSLFLFAGLVTAFLGAVLVFRLLMCHTEEKHFGWSLFLAAFMGLCCFQLGYELSFDANILADKGPTRQTETVVTAVGTTSYATGRYSRRRVYSVALAENEWLGDEGRVKVSSALAEQLRRGDRVRLVLHPGAFGVPWLECEALS